MIGKETWRRGLAVLILVAAAAVFYALSSVKESTGRDAGKLVFSNQYMPVSGSTLRRMPSAADADVDREAAPGNVEAPGIAEMTTTGDTAVESAGQTIEEKPISEPQQTGQATSAPAPAAEKSAPFDRYRFSRIQGASRRIETLQSLLDHGQMDAVAREELGRTLLGIVDSAAKEETAEGLLVARGLRDAVVMLGAAGAEVVVTERLTREQAGRIGDVVSRIAEVPLDKITIVDGAPME